jgi:N-acetyl-alpha-D-muramate 1-phosphate uridylyltransferase
MKAFILAAGLGTRLAPFTFDRPKALVELKGITLLERAIRKINELEVSEIIINIHHFGDQILDFLRSNQNFNLPIVVSDERNQLLDTGGALLKAKELLGSKEPFLLYNVDVLSTIDLNSLSSYHFEGWIGHHGGTGETYRQIPLL